MAKKKSIYINLWDYANENYPFQIFLGGRGIGKTFSWLDGAVSGKIKEGNRFIHMRRTADAWELQLDTDKGEGANPFKNLNKKKGYNYGFHKMSKKLAGIYQREEEEEGRLIHVGAPIGYGVALTTMANIRGLDFSECSDLFYDEFCKERHEKNMRGECDAFLNAIETINRNRELEGEPPCRVWLASNSSDIYNPYFQELGLVSICEQMMRRGIQDKYIPERKLAIHLLEATEEFKEKKAQTALYCLTRGTRFEEMALENKFAYNDFSLIGARSLKGYIPWCSINNKVYIYRKKGDRDIYISYAPTKCVNFDCNTEQGRRSFMQRVGVRLTGLFTDSTICFESYELKAIVLDILL